MQRGMIEYQRIAGLRFGRDAIRRREMFGDPFVRKDAGFGRRQPTHAPMRAAHQLDRGLLTAHGRQRQPYIEARVVMGGATAVVVRMPFQASVPVGQAADAANISGEIRQAELSVGSRQSRHQLARQLGRHAAFEIRQPDRSDRYPVFSHGRIPAAGVEKSKSVAHDLGDAKKA